MVCARHSEKEGRFSGLGSTKPYPRCRRLTSSRTVIHTPGVNRSTCFIAVPEFSRVSTALLDTTMASSTRVEHERADNATFESTRRDTERSSSFLTGKTVHLSWPFSQAHARRVDDNSDEPGRHLRTPLELRQMAKGRNKRILNRILGILVIAKLTKRYAVECG